VISRRCFFLTVAILASLGLTTSTSHAQQPSTPDAAQLYTQMNSAMQQEGSVHIQVHTAKLAAEPQQTVREITAGSIDISSTQQVLHAVYTTTYSNANTQSVVIRDRTTYVGVDGRIAQRDSTAPWSCQTMSSQAQAQVYTLTSFSFLPVTPSFIGGVKPSAVLGVAVWRIMIDLGNRTDVLNIAQNTYRLVRIMELSGVKTAATGVRKTFSDFSQYGETVSAQLPAVCR
jgi:hypothetical protein